MMTPGTCASSQKSISSWCASTLSPIHLPGMDAVWVSSTTLPTATPHRSVNARFASFMSALIRVIGL